MPATRTAELPLSVAQLVALSNVNLPADTVAADAHINLVDDCLVIEVLTETRSFDVLIDIDGDTDVTDHGTGE